MADCPICRNSMRVVNRDDLELDVCDSCEGVWLDPHEFVQLNKLKESLSRVSSEPDAWNFKCPSCGISERDVVTTEFGGVIRCLGCSGVFVPRQLLGSSAPVKSEKPGEETSWFKETFFAIGDLLEALSLLR